MKFTFFILVFISDFISTEFPLIVFPFAGVGGETKLIVPNAPQPSSIILSQSLSTPSLQISVAPGFMFMLLSSQSAIPHPVAERL